MILVEFKIMLLDADIYINIDDLNFTIDKKTVCWLNNIEQLDIKYWQPLYS